MIDEHKTTGFAVVLGAGTMGAQIAAHLANVGWRALLLDIPGGEPTPDEAAKGLTATSPEVRNRPAIQGLAKAKKLKPAPFYHEKFADRIQFGNFDDDLPKIKDADWVIEAIVERSDIKRQMWDKVQQHAGPQTYLSTNTSGLSVSEMTEGCSEEIRARFFGAHFFNPPRYLKLLELIPLDQTAQDTMDRAVGFGEKVLGKRVVIARDTPGFIGNRLGIYSMMSVFQAVKEFDMTVEEVDALTGPLIGRPRSATFRLADIVGLDVLASVASHQRERLETPEEKAAFELPEVVQTMLAEGRLGEKSGAGFFRRLKDGTIEAMDLKTGEYRPRQKPRFDHFAEIEKLPLKERIKALIAHDSREGKFLWRLFSDGLCYALTHGPSLCDDPEPIDNAIKWGFGWEMGPIETLDAIGPRAFAERLDVVPPTLQQLFNSGRETFYQGDTVYSWSIGGARQIDLSPEFMTPGIMAEKRPKLLGNADASLYDLGDDVFCAAIHSKMNTLGPSVMETILKGADKAEQEGRGLVITGLGDHFSVGFNLQLFLMMIGAGEWDEVANGAHAFQQSLLRLRYAKVPIVSAVFGYTLGGACELAMHSSSVVASAETYMGLPEVGVGIIPGGGGASTMLHRALKDLPADADPYPAVRKIIETLGFGKVGTSAFEAQEYGFLRPGLDQIVINPDRVLWGAKQAAINLYEAGYQPPEPPKVMAHGDGLYSRLYVELYNLKTGGMMSDHDFLILSELAWILSGGDGASAKPMPEAYFYRLEVIVNAKLAQQPKTWERMKHMLEKGKPLRN
ncbi:MAG: enoyl-CoA hydratase/isomerase family protein [Armatimonadetes bacterium]|nr:enoyl-CoA hydratase/isomerase family protein [Armatimonadota bacterium]